MSEDAGGSPDGGPDGGAVDTGELKPRKKRFFRVKGVPGDVEAYALPLRP